MYISYAFIYQILGVHAFLRWTKISIQLYKIFEFFLSPKEPKTVFLGVNGFVFLKQTYE